MIAFPNAKINIGLNVVSKREDGFHNLETIFYPVKLSDALEFVPAEKTELSNSGFVIDGQPENNLVLKAYQIIKKDFRIPPVKFHLHKAIPFGAGLGGGSADAAFALKMLNEYFKLNLTHSQLEEYASRLGSDCPFFIRNKPVFASGTGNIFQNIDLDLTEHSIVILKPPFSVNTAQAYKGILPVKPDNGLMESIQQPIEKWKDLIFNDFEKTVFQKFPQIQELKELLYSCGALYSSMSGSGSAVFGIFRHLPTNIDNKLPEGILIYR